MQLEITKIIEGFFHSVFSVFFLLFAAMLHDDAYSMEGNRTAIVCDNVVEMDAITQQGIAAMIIMLYVGH